MIDGFFDSFSITLTRYFEKMFHLTEILSDIENFNDHRCDNEPNETPSTAYIWKNATI